MCIKYKGIKLPVPPDGQRQEPKIIHGKSNNLASNLSLIQKTINDILGNVASNSVSAIQITYFDSENGDVKSHLFRN